MYYANKSEITLQQEMNLLKSINESHDGLTYNNWLITLKENGKIIGSINLHVNVSNPTAEFNNDIDDRYTGNGYMTEPLMSV